ncbi:uncharacterized protein B0T15DRAFT_528755 [Chaetomium strumarium]|uniref:Uncharacterized protein n=1 Tax=Chaetomium strumarium TaxID=1170767 RepID=A0AAJ0GVL0_9PEZI|nr:hypothetical protein B0T15DRAFT_528755 [Chaetomium strumarium]
MVNLAEIGAKLTAGRQPSQELSPTARAAIIGAVAAGASQSAVARAFRIERTAVYRILQRFESSTTVKSKPQTGQPEILTCREKRYILRPHLPINDILGSSPLSDTQVAYIKENPIDEGSSKG